MFNQGLYYEVNGHGDPLLFLHGIGGTHTMFQPQVDYFSKKFQTITVDLKGSGQSDSLNCLPSKCLDSHCESILTLCHDLHLTNITLVGVSYGGIVAQHLAITQPQLVDKLILVDTYANTIPKSGEEFALFLVAGFIAFSVWLPSKWIMPIFKRYERWELAHQEIVDIIQNRRAKEVTNQLMGCFGLNNLPALSKLEIPVLGIVGDDEPLVIEKMREVIEPIPDGSLHIIKNAFDPTNLCQPEQFNAIVDEFIRENSMKKKVLGASAQLEVIGV